MGNKPSLQSKQAIHDAADDGLTAVLEAMLRKASPQAINRGLLEWEDEEGRTALIAAARNGHIKAVNLLLRFGASVQHMSGQLRGSGTALHEAILSETDRHIVDILLRYGSCPFVENSLGQTALDYAFVKGDVALLRKLEMYGYFAQYMKMRVSHEGESSTVWEPKWVAIVPRYGCPFNKGEKKSIQRVMKVYDSVSNCTPVCEVDLEGAKTEQLTSLERHVQVTLSLGPRHSKPENVYSREGASGEFLLYFLTCGHESEHIKKFARIVNMQYEQHAHTIEMVE